MNGNFLMLYGERYELTDEQAKVFSEKVIKAKSPFDRVKNEEKYFFIDGDGEVVENTDYYSTYVNSMYSAANYCTDEKLLQQRAWHETLSRLLWRFSYQNGWNDDLWNDNVNSNFSICWNTWDRKYGVCETSISKGIDVYFITEQIAERAINEIVVPFCKKHPDFVW